jgi:acyl-[acyl-carrier-protein]-phospholipid O-acyltransferase/long-chain-fatty-acid--[acyl-carrier-protein] ligase
MPNLGATVAAFFGLQAFGRIPAMLDPAAGEDNLLRATRAAAVAAIVTSRRFIAAARLEGAVERLAGVTAIVYIEDIDARIDWKARLRGRLDRAFAGRMVRRGRRPDDPALILFTAGVEGAPKGVALSHRNLLANVGQTAARVALTPADVVLNALPLSHAFGLTAGLLLPIASGVKTVLYPNPLHYRKMPEVAYDCDATILFGTDTFLAGYANVANPYDFHTLRWVFAAAERVRPETRQIWAEIFGVRILEGYGATEAAPLLAINTPMHARAGAVGRLLPGIEARLDPVDGLTDGGRLIVRGPNIMLGYIDGDRPGAILPPPDGWHDTGDIVAIDCDGFVTIQGRAARFARVGDAMVSLAAVEDWAAGLWPDAAHAAAALPDARQGERIVLVSTRPGATRADFAAYLRGRDLPDAATPAEIIFAPAIPTLRPGKTDYAAVRAIARRPRISEVA